MTIQYKEISAEQTHELRHKVLRPHQDISEMVYPLDQERTSIHLGAFSGNRLIGIVSIFQESQDGELNKGHWRIRGMAVAEDFRKQGLGKVLVKKCIESVKENKATGIWCNARTTAINFYLAIGFKLVGDEFEIEGIGPHYIAHFVL